MTIHFHKSLVGEATKALKESKELLDVCLDLEKVLHQMEQVEYSNLVLTNDANEQQWRLQQARELDDTVRQKYPVIDIMLNVADKFPVNPSFSASSSNDYELIEYRNLMQDYYGILCHTLLKKKFIEDVKEFIERVD